MPISEKRPDGRRVRNSFCRVCHNGCPILVELEGDRIVSIKGDPDNPVWRGFTCIKGRVQHERLNSPDRLLHSQKRRPDGSFAAIGVDDAIDEIAEGLEAVIKRHGKDAVAMYIGTSIVTNSLMEPTARAFMNSIESAMVFTASTIDKPGKAIARAYHGTWGAPAQGFDEPEAALIVGSNGLVSIEGSAPMGNPGWLVDAIKAGMELVVIDPRRTEVARRATVHLQALPGTDSAILAAMLREVLTWELHDAEFCEENVEGLDRLRETLEPFTIERVAAHAQIAPTDLAKAARLFAEARRAYAFMGTGPNMSGSGTLNEYLLLCLETLCGRWLRAGDRVRNAPSLSASATYRAQPTGPTPPLGYGRKLRVRGLEETPAGLPTAALPDEILLPGPGQIRALISCGGNPASAWPGTAKARRALESLDLLVQIDPWMSQTAALADYVIAPTLSLEAPEFSRWTDLLAILATGFGPAESHAQHTPAIVEPPRGSDLIAEWDFFYRLARRLDLSIKVGGGPEAPGALSPFEFDMAEAPSAEEILEAVTAGSRVPLEEVKRHPHGALFPKPEVRVLEREPDCTDRLDVGSAPMMDLLRKAAIELEPARPSNGELRLLTRRVREMYNSAVNDGRATKGRQRNPLLMHPDDLAARGLSPGDDIEVSSAHGVVLAVVDADDTLLPGVVSLTHGYGPLRGSASAEAGTNVNALLANDVDFDPFSAGQPRMSNLRVSVSRIA